MGHDAHAGLSSSFLALSALRKMRELKELSTAQRAFSEKHVPRTFNKHVANQTRISRSQNWGCDPCNVAIADDKNLAYHC